MRTGNLVTTCRLGGAAILSSTLFPFVPPNICCLGQFIQNLVLPKIKKAQLDYQSIRGKHTLKLSLWGDALQMSRCRRFVTAFDSYSDHFHVAQWVRWVNANAANSIQLAALMQALMKSYNYCNFKHCVSAKNQPPNRIQCVKQARTRKSLLCYMSTSENEPFRSCYFSMCKGQ